MLLAAKSSFEFNAADSCFCFWPTEAKSKSFQSVKRAVSKGVITIFGEGLSCC